MTIKFPYGMCEKPVANNHQTINCDKCGLWIHIKCNKINKQTYIYLMHESCHWYCMLCTKMFLPYSILNNNKFKHSSENKSHLFIQQNQQYLILRISLKLSIQKTTLLNTLQSNIWILLSMTLTTLFPCFT